MRGLFISIEGPDGAGKSSVIKSLVPKLEEYFGREIIQTREPGGSPIAEKIRDLILDINHSEMDDRTEALLYAASRRQHLVERILPNLKKGEVILCDRFVDSSLAYQGAGRGLGAENIWTINAFAIEDVLPDITIYLDVDAQVGLNRIGAKNSNRQKDRLELEDISFHNKVSQGYHKIIERDPDRFIIVDANQDLETVLASAWELLHQRLAETENSVKLNLDNENEGEL